MTAAQAGGGARPTSAAQYRVMLRGSRAGSGRPAARPWSLNPAVWPLALPSRLLWLAAPALARRISQPAGRAPPQPLTARQAQALRLIARRTWRYFETFVTAADNFLPPDNFQETPRPGRRAPHLAHQYRALPSVGHRRAHDMGWIGSGPRLRALERHASDHAADAALSRASLQLARHPRPARAGPGLCLVGRQRQSGRASDRRGPGLPRLGGRSRSRRTGARACAIRCALRTAALAPKPVSRRSRRA